MVCSNVAKLIKKIRKVKKNGTDNELMYFGIQERFQPSYNMEKYIHNTMIY